MKTIFSQVMQVGRATVFIVGVAVVLAVMLGVSTTALAATPGDPDRPVVVGQPPNPTNKSAKLVGQGEALNSDVKVTKARSNAQEERVGFNFGKVVLRNSSWSQGQTGGKNEIRFDDTPGTEGQTIGFLKINGVDGESR
jgi:hypothetical protein